MVGGVHLAVVCRMPVDMMYVLCVVCCFVFVVRVVVYMIGRVYDDVCYAIWVVWCVSFGVRWMWCVVCHVMGVVGRVQCVVY